MNDANLHVDHTTLEMAERIARERDCSVAEVVRDAISEYAGSHVNGLPPTLAPAPGEPDTELAVTIAMPFPSRPVTIGIVKRSTLGPNPVLSEFEEEK
jgi:hypothetical protein